MIEPFLTCRRNFVSCMSMPCTLQLSLLRPCVKPQYLLKLPADPGIVLPGLWLLFVMDAAGVPSVAADLKIKILATPAPPAAPTAAAAAARTPAAASNAAITAPAPVVVGAALQPAVSAGG